MRMWILPLVVLIKSVFVAGLAFGGHGVGNGGSAVVCKNERGEEAYFALDFWEHRLKLSIPMGTGLYAELFNQDKSPYELYSIYMQRLYGIDDERYSRYMAWLPVYINSYVEMDPFDFIEDYGEVRLDQNCKMQQAIIRYVDDRFTPRRVRYFVNKWVWAHLNAINRAALMVHEVVYGEAFDAGQTDSAKSRAFVALLFSNEFKNISKEEYKEILQQLDMPYQESR